MMMEARIPCVVTYGTTSKASRLQLQHEIRDKRETAIDYIVVQPNDTGSDEAKDDGGRRERRKASNRNAARRCREKKIQEHLKLKEAKESADQKIHLLTKDNRRMRKEINRLRSALASTCQCKQVKSEEQCKEEILPIKKRWQEEDTLSSIDKDSSSDSVLDLSTCSPPDHVLDLSKVQHPP